MQKTLLPRRLACSLILIVTARTHPLSAEVKITAVANSIQLQDGQTSGPLDLLFRVDGTKNQPLVSIISPTQGTPALSVKGIATKLADTKDGIFWKAPADLSGLPLNSSFSALVVVQLDNATSDVLVYQISNAMPAVDADVSPGSDTISLNQTRETDFTVNLKNRPVRGLTVCQSSLGDINTGNHLSEQYLGMYLANPDLAANPQVNTPYLTLAAASTKVRLIVLPSFHRNGIFAGTVGICSASKASLATLKLTVNSSCLWAKIIGSFLIFFGICLYVLVTVVLRQRSRQLMALFPAARLSESLRELHEAATRVSHHTHVEFSTLLGKQTQSHSLNGLISQLSPAKLKEAGYIPSLFASPFQSSDAGTAYQQFLQSMSAQQLNNAVIVRDGLERVWALWPQLDQESAREALVELDKLALKANGPDLMRPQVDDLVAGISPRATQLTQMLSSVRESFRRTGGILPSTHEIAVQLDYVSGIGWFIWGVLTFLFGCAVLIWSNHGFGTWQDLLKCFLWGLGIQAVGQGIQALAPSAAATTFSLQIGR